MPRWIRGAAFTALAFTLLVLGAALRPLAFPENHTQTPILSAIEIGFVQDMTAHHQQALIMTQRLDPGVDPTVLRLAQQLDATQRMEIGTMLGWLRLANASPLSSNPMSWMHADDAAPHEHSGSSPVAQTKPKQAPGTTMPGMATNAELDALATARGRDAEILFLQLMFRHHQGGIVMAQAVDQMLAGGPVKETARSMIHGQGQETGLMGMLLAQRGAAPLP